MVLIYYVLVDGNVIPKFDFPSSHESIGDSLEEEHFPVSNLLMTLSVK